ncbi:Lipoyl synthase [Rhizoctonia solani]|uniref:Lipoyl synthase, mitochondrial n=1 Tax=Rhizoctonia solani TaxID=456999 RepID=A0A8H7ICW4_9AGAM|nr:Lipoyl synthase [Rhizoctonia solani]
MQTNVACLAFHISRRFLTIPSRSLATSAPKVASTFSERLAVGPSLDDFVADNVDLDESGPSKVTLGNTSQPRLPSHLKTKIPTGQSYTNIRKDLRGLGLHTVCEEARCPNIGDCWGGGKKAATATIMVGLLFNILVGNRLTPVLVDIKDTPSIGSHEPENTAEAISRWGLGYIVLTSVDRDDLADGGAAHFASTIAKIKHKAPSILVEALTGDFQGDLSCVERVAKSGLDVYAHNVETVEALTPFVRDRRAKFHQSLAVLAHAKKSGVKITKTSIMLGVGETEEQVTDTLKALRANSVDVVTFGQYMRPTKKHMKVSRYVEPSEFEMWKKRAEDMGFAYVASGPLVRSSYKAGEYFIENMLRNGSNDKGALKTASLLSADAGQADRPAGQSRSD